MPNLWKFFSKSGPNAPKVEEYRFVAAQELNFGPEETEPPAEETDAELLPEEPVEEKFVEEEQVAEEEVNPVNYAQIQSEMILEDARRQAEEIIRQAQDEAEACLQQAREQAAEEGYRDGFQEGTQQGLAKALEENIQAREALAKKLEDDVEAFIRKAERMLDQQMDDNLDDLRDLALAVAEKVVCVSLKSSSEVIGRMIQTAVDKRKRREWVHIYIAECDAKRLTSLPAALTAALAELSDRVRIIPMADDEAGTCIIESPNEIIDASAATQMQNIRDMLSSHSGGGIVGSFNFSDK